VLGRRYRTSITGTSILRSSRGGCQAVRPPSAVCHIYCFPWACMTVTCEKLLLVVPLALSGWSQREHVMTSCAHQVDVEQMKLRWSGASPRCLRPICRSADPVPAAGTARSGGAVPPLADGVDRGGAHAGHHARRLRASLCPCPGPASALGPHDIYESTALHP